MAALDLTPLLRSTVGFDRVPALFDSALQRDGGGYPPCNIERCGDDSYRIVMAVAGCTKNDLEIVVERNRVTVYGKIDDEPAREYLHRGIAGRSFERFFELADFVEVKSANLAEGLLAIDLKREISEEMKPRKIEIHRGKLVNFEPDKNLKSAA